MIAIWYAVVSFTLIVYIILDGRNFGAGMLQWFVAKTPEERRQVIAAIGPLWIWHEVWLLGFGGHINDRLWQAYWDFIFVCSNFLLAILFGAAAGNVARGVPVDAQGNFSMAFFTD